MKRKQNRISVIVLSCLAVFIILTLLVVWYLSTRPDSTGTIILPEPETDVSVHTPPTTTVEDPFLKVNTDNALQIVAELSRPDSYHQTCTVTVVSGDHSHVNQVELWVNGSLLRAVISNERDVRHVLTDHSTAYVWYEDSDEPLQVHLADGITADDVLGLPTYETLLRTAPGQITDAEYLILDNTQARCVYICAKAGDELTELYWIDLETGLLAKADVLENSQQVYTVQQDSLDVLAAQDEAFEPWFLLPDGSAPFTVQRAAPQP